LKIIETKIVEKDAVVLARYTTPGGVLIGTEWAYAGPDEEIIVIRVKK